MGCAGNPEIRTPNLDRLAAMGLRFDNFFCASPVCENPNSGTLPGRSFSALLETAPADTQGIVLDGWEFRDGHLIVPDTPGTGFDLAPETVARRIREEGGFCISV